MNDTILLWFGLVGWLLAIVLLLLLPYVARQQQPDTDYQQEKQIRLKYQHIVYKLCSLYDDYKGNHTSRGTGITVDELYGAIEQELINRDEARNESD